jgi:hypothetical protein
MGAMLDGLTTFARSGQAATKKKSFVIPMPQSGRGIPVATTNL